MSIDVYVYAGLHIGFLAEKGVCERVDEIRFLPSFYSL